MDSDKALRLIASQDGIARKGQLLAAGVTREFIRAQIVARRWAVRTPSVVSSFTGTATRDQQLWIAALHGGEGALVGGLAAAELAGLRHFQPSETRIYVPYGSGSPRRTPDGVTYVRSRRTLDSLRAAHRMPPRMQIIPAVLLWVAEQDSTSVVRGLVAALIQQRLAEVPDVAAWVEKLAPLRHASLIRETLDDAAGGAHSKAEMDIKKMCRRFGLQLPVRQVKRWDANGQVRFTDCEWRTEAGRTVHLEVEGPFHLDVDQWSEDVARQRALTRPDVDYLRCTSFEARDGDALAADLIRLGVPRTKAAAA